MDTINTMLNTWREFNDPLPQMGTPVFMANEALSAIDVETFRGACHITGDGIYRRKAQDSASGYKYWFPIPRRPVVQRPKPTRSTK